MPTAGLEPPNKFSSLEGKRILVVEEEPMIGWLEEQALIAVGCDVVGPVQTIADAKGLIVETAIDAALVDGTIRGIPAVEIAVALSQKNIPFAIVTAHGLYLSHGAAVPEFRDAVFLDKPFSDEQILTTVEALLNRRALA
jgi:DNA-binding NtrC family response regulator